VTPERAGLSRVTRERQFVPTAASSRLCLSPAALQLGAAQLVSSGDYAAVCCIRSDLLRLGAAASNDFVYAC
jgi:hypothetical protein